FLQDPPGRTAGSFHMQERRERGRNVVYSHWIVVDASAHSTPIKDYGNMVVIAVGQLMRGTAGGEHVIRFGQQHQVRRTRAVEPKLHGSANRIRSGASAQQFIVGENSGDVRRPASDLRCVTADSPRICIVLGSRFVVQIKKAIAVVDKPFSCTEFGSEGL